MTNENTGHADSDQLLASYRDGLLDDTLPFWIRHAVDREHGGFITSLDRDGSVVDTDKCSVEDRDSLVIMRSQGSAMKWTCSS